MMSLSNYAVLISAAAAVGAVCAALLYRRLIGMFMELCGTEGRARFWSAYLALLLVLAPMLGVAMAVSFSGPSRYFELDVQRALLFALGGLVTALLIMGMRLARAPEPTAAPETWSPTTPAQ